MDEETRARTEALEMVVVALLADRMGRRRLEKVLSAQPCAMRSRPEISPLHGYEWREAALFWRNRLMRLAREGGKSGRA